MSQGVLVAVLATLIVNEVGGISPWIATRLARWAARNIYAADTVRADRRAEEWDALITESIPTNISALCFGLSLGGAAVGCLAMRRAASALSIFSHAIAELTGRHQAARDQRERLAEAQRQACLDLLRAAIQLRVQMASTAHRHRNERDAQLEMQGLVLAAQQQAATVMLLAPAVLANSAGELAAATARLATAAGDSPDIRITQLISPLDFSDLDERVAAFRRHAVELAQS